MIKDTFIIRTEWYNSFKLLSNEDKGILLENLFLYHSENNAEINLESLPVKLVWNLIIPTVNRANEAYDKRRETSKNNGMKGGRPPKEKNLNQNLKKPKKPNETLSDSDSDSVNNSKEKRVKKKISFSPPQLLEIENYFLEKTKSIEFSKIHSQRFKDFYESKNWMIGKNKMANWKSAVSGWINRQKDFEKEKSSAKKEKKTGSESFLETVKQSISYE